MQPTVIFLDMDGPFANPRSMIAGLRFDPISASVVTKALGVPNVRAVISSTTRKRCHNEEDAHALMERYGLTGITFHKHWRTGGSRATRQQEIQEWMDAHSEPGVRYIAIDDDPIKLLDVLHIVADHNGIPYVGLLTLMCAVGKADVKTLDDWTGWLDRR